MYIKRIEIDGFKSYAQKQIIDNFDTQFNAITGLNGSGKSNILDAICFVLGITDLKCIRAENANALVYKNGQAGITKCSVTITFDNRDKSNTPLNYSQFDEIIVRRQHVVNGRTHYTVNGSAMTNGNVCDFFRTVGLNVNNPHFLIMQGRITKVLNMKPHEILGMVEEAAGTKMYDSKRAAAVSFIAKKDAKMIEIDNLMSNEIQPKVNRLKEEKHQFLTYQKLNRDIDILKKQLDAYEYWQYLQEEKRLTDLATNIDETMTAKGEEIEKLKEEHTAIAEKITELEAERDSRVSEEKNKLENAVTEAFNIRADLDIQRKNAEQSVQETQDEIDRINQELVTDRLNLEETKRKLMDSEKNHGGEEEIGKKAEETVANAKAKLEALAKGLSTDDNGQAVTLEAQITSTRSALQAITTNIKVAQRAIDSIEPELAAKKREYEHKRKQSSTDTKELDQCENEVKRCEDLLGRINFDEQTYSDLKRREPECRQEMNRANNEVLRWYNYFGNLEFRYKKDQVWSGFDEAAEIHGTVASLFKLKSLKYAAALDVVCASQIYNVVFSHQQTAATFVDKGFMIQRRTIMPLDKIMAPSMEGLQKRVDAAKQICEQRGDECHVALDLIEYDPIYQRIMEFIFRGILVVEDAKLASTLAFNPSVKLRVVTTDGDDIRPGGTLSGGSHAKQEAPLLHRLNGFHSAIMNHKRLNAELKNIAQELQALEPTKAKYYELRHQLDKVRGRWETLRENLKSSPIEILKGEIAQLEQELPKHTAEIEKSQAQSKELSAKIKDLEAKKKDEKNYTENEKKKYEKELKEAQQTLKNIKSRFENARDTLERLRKEVAKVETTIEKQDRDIKELMEKKQTFSEELHQREIAVEAALTEEQQQKAALDKFMAELKEKDNQMKKKRQQEDKMKKAVRDAENELNTLERQYKKSVDDASECKRLAAQIKKTCKAIADIESALGKDGDYSFVGFDKKKEFSRMEKMKNDRETMGKTLNPQAHAILDNAQAQVDDLVKKTEQVKRDKQTLLQTIETLDEKKKKELGKAYEQINKDFGNIFATLLVGAGAKLEPPKGKNALEGLEVKVCFNGQYKESLNELSGGQRSLVALSLILAMLKFKPAPIYILDEVDSALDSSHTQNIGMMIKNYFTTSQFIIVSLKEGMFSNANVIYRTKFVDGTSKVTRTLGDTQNTDENKKKRKSSS